MENLRGQYTKLLNYWHDLFCLFWTLGFFPVWVDQTKNCPFCYSIYLVKIKSEVFFFLLTNWSSPRKKKCNNIVSFCTDSREETFWRSKQLSSWMFVLQVFSKFYLLSLWTRKSLRIRLVQPSQTLTQSKTEFLFSAKKIAYVIDNLLMYANMFLKDS